jgi:hypothetical protein
VLLLRENGSSDTPPKYIFIFDPIWQDYFSLSDAIDQIYLTFDKIIQINEVKKLGLILKIE